MALDVRGKIAKWGASGFWRSRRNQVLVGCAVLGVLIIGGVFLFRSLVEPPTEVEEVAVEVVEGEEGETLDPVDVEPIPVEFELLADAVEVQPLTRCVNLDAARSGWETAQGRRNLGVLDPTMMRVDAASVVEYVGAGGEIEELVALQVEEELETLFYIDVSGSAAAIPGQIRALQNYRTAGGTVDYLELTTSFAGLYTNQLNRHLPDIRAALPGAPLILAGQGLDVSELADYDYDAYGLTVAYESGVESLADVPLNYSASLNNVRRTVTEVLGSITTERELWVTDYRLSEDLNIERGPSYAPYENLQLGGVWGQAMATALGYHELMLAETTAVCIETLSGSPQNSLYYLEKNTPESGYAPLTDAIDYEFSPSGQVFYMLSKAMGEAGADDSEEFKINNESETIALWVFSDEAGTRGWVVNAGQNQLALDMSRYGFAVTGYEIKSAPITQVVLSRDEVTTQVGGGLEDTSKILLPAHSVSILNLEVLTPDAEETADEVLDPEVETGLQTQIPLNPEVDNPNDSDGAEVAE